MTDNQNEQSLSELDKEADNRKEKQRLNDRIAIDGVGVDGILRNFVQYADSSLELEIPLILFVEGTTISGQLIGGKKFWTLQRDLFIKSGMSEEVAEAMTSYKSIYEPPADDEPAPTLSFIHLKNAQVLMHDANIQYGGDLLWRGKLKSVSAFAFGQLVAARN